MNLPSPPAGGGSRPPGGPPPAPQRPKIRVRDATSWWTDHEDGTVTLTVLRRTDQASGVWLKVENRGADEQEALDVYEDYCSAGYERSARQAQRRSHWGPLGTGKM